jgi:predicted HTH transcriptional regulator
MKKFKIFISGVQKEMKAERRAVKNSILGDVLLSEYFDVFLFEDSIAKSKSAEQLYVEEVKKSDIYIGILGIQYGKPNKDGISPTDTEYRLAKQKNKHILIYIKGKSSEDKKRESYLQRMIKDIRDPNHGYSYKRFDGIKELSLSVYASLLDYLKEKGIIGRGAFDEGICESATLTDIDEAKVAWFVDTAKKARRFPVGMQVSPREVFTHLNLMHNGKLTNAAVLLFGKRPKKYFLQAEVKCLQLSGIEVNKDFPSYKIYDDNLFEQVDKAVDFVMDVIRQGVVQQKNTPQFQRPFEIPVFVVQEAIVNALAHRNYNTTSGVQVMVFADRVEIWNSGSLPPELSLEDLRKPHTSYPANQLLAHVLYLGDYIQKVGSGTLEMIKQCRDHGIPEPEFECQRNVEFRTILPRDVFTQSLLDKMALNERQMTAMKSLKTTLQITNAGYQRLTTASRKTAMRDLDDLVKKGLLVRKGERRGVHYLLVASRRMRQK